MVDRSLIERYVGLAYVPGQFDCADLTERVQREVFGREVLLPKDRPRPIAPIGMARAIAAHKDSVARLRPTGQIQDGDAALLARGAGFPTHIGVVVQIGGEWYVLHNASERIRSVLTLIRNLPLAGWRLQGIYEWI